MVIKTCAGGEARSLRPNYVNTPATLRQSLSRCLRPSSVVVPRRRPRTICRALRPMATASGRLIVMSPLILPWPLIALCHVFGKMLRPSGPKGGGGRMASVRSWGAPFDVQQVEAHAQARRLDCTMTQQPLRSGNGDGGGRPSRVEAAMPASTGCVTFSYWPLCLQRNQE